MYLRNGGSRMSRSSIALLAGTALGLAAPLLTAQGSAARPAAPAGDSSFTQRDAHLHGKVVVNVALEGSLLSVEFDAPAVNVVGFEHAPRTDAQKREVAAVDRWLASGVGVIGVSPAAGCVRQQVDYMPPKLDGGDHDDEHDHDHDRDAGASAAGETHADYRARFTYTCANPAALPWADLWLVRRLKNVAEIEVNLVTPQLQTQRTLGADATRIELR
jgi:Protein of unknown function (DUF2796)